MPPAVMRGILYASSLSLMVAFPFIAMRATRSEGRWKIEEIGILLSLYALPFFAFYSAGQFGGPAFITVAKIFIALSLFAWFVKAFFLYRDIDFFVKPFRNWISVFVLFYPVMAGLSILQVAPGQRDIGTKLLIITLIPHVLLYILMLNTVRRRSVMKWCLIGILIATTFACIGGVYELLTGKLVLKARFAGGENVTTMMHTGTGAKRISSFNIDADLHSQAVCFGLGPLLSFLVLARRNRDRLFLLALVVLFCFNIIATGSKAAWIGMAVLLLVFASLMQVKKKGLVIAAALVLITVTVAVMEVFTNAAILERLFETEKSGAHSNRTRYVDWKISSIAFWERPVFGYGLGSSVSGVPKYHRFAPDLLPKTDVLYGAHISILTQVMSEMGIIGLIVHFIPYFFSVRYLLWIRRHSQEAFDRHLAVGICSALVCNFVMMFFHPIGSSELQFLFWAIVVNTLILVKRSDSRQRLMQEQRLSLALQSFPSLR